MHSHHHVEVTVGRRKTAVARVTVLAGSGKIIINNKSLEQFFPVDTQQAEVLLPFVATETSGQYDVSVNVDGGGVNGQAGAIKLAIARALVTSNEEFRSKLRTFGLLTRDPRMVERKKYGQKKARKRFQFSKR
ncbi:MAG: 30S ribosomal protein S9 [Ignavibacteriae bacterium]|nr:30S ribosomal protein S9 [Ignavibacteriota bacterium]